MTLSMSSSAPLALTVSQMLLGFETVAVLSLLFLLSRMPFFRDLSDTSHD